MTSIKKVQSPCKGICKYVETENTSNTEENVERICGGCGRTAEEITEWIYASEERKEAIVEASKQRQVK
jgi:predicted Fe-S protein YdhL (DUF1289 family)